MKIKKYMLTIITFTFIVSCGTGNVLYEKENVTIIDNKSHYKIIVDYHNTSDFKRAGELLGEGCLEVIPDYEYLLDSYIAELFPGRYYQKYLKEVLIMKESLQDEYLLELEGFSSNFSITKNIAGDGKLSPGELLLFNFIGDLIPRSLGCSFVGINSELSSTGDSQLSRNLEWFPGTEFQLTKLATITQINRPGNDIVSIGYAGFMGVMTGFNDQKLFVGVLDSPVISSLSVKGKTPYMFQLRSALESANSIGDIVTKMSDVSGYKVNHNIAISDPNRSVVLENYTRGKIRGGLKSSVRSEDSKLNKDIEWSIPGSIVAVNAFLLDGYPNNYSYVPHNYIRLKSMSDFLNNIGGFVGLDDLKKISTTETPGHNMDYIGSIYNTENLYSGFTMQIVLLRPSTSEAEIFFYPRNSNKRIKRPKFEKILLFDNE